VLVSGVLQYDTNTVHLNSWIVLSQGDDFRKSINGVPTDMENMMK
jgi:hypothetical protein